MSPGHALIDAVSPTDARLQMPNVAVTFAAPNTCTAIRVAPEKELRALLLPAHIAASSETNVRVDKSDAKSGGCKLRVEVYRASTDSALDAATQSLSSASTAAAEVFDIASAVNANIALAVPSNMQLRGTADVSALTLERMSLQVAQVHYDVVLRGNARDDVKPVGSTLTLHGRKCSPHLQNAALVQRHVVPSDVDAGTLTIETSDDVAVSMGHELDCAAMLEVAARAPLLLADSADDALSYLRAFDVNLNETFDPSARMRVFANIELHASSSAVASAMAPLVASELLVENVAAIPPLPYNAPTKAMTMSILGGLVALVSMLVAVALAKTRHEKKCEERHRNASKAAQIRRVSIRMASPVHSRNAFGEEHEEEKDDDDAYGEADGLL